ncbi:glycosyltransferase family 2 protein [Bacteroides sp. ET71]|uniref:glycosyltransferase family 2 protein n=1 Tax=Bacteroides sp. ET71 TaxID=2939421 RepID=UPI002011CC39|nr:glycosyltransferase family 2 protein [Bacteroides sp. ET71]MCL1616564.1 glycosyltransferase family 2 protein [Bacteroides sp. ET71]
MRILALITLFHPSPEVADNMASYASGADALFLWDNTPGGAVLSLPVEAEKKVIRYRRGANVGIGKALNEAVCLLEEGGFTHLLTMDQDSAFVPSTFEAYKRQVAGWQDKRPVVFVPRVNVSRKTTEDWVETQGFIVSGSIFPRFTLSEVGAFEERLVIDGIDVEYGYRLRRAEGHVVQVSAGELKHELGYPLTKRFLCWHPVSLNYSPLRVYYIARAFLYLQRAYPEYVDRRLVRKLVWMRPFYIVLMERQKGPKLLAWFQGVCHGLGGRLERDAYRERMNR